MTEKNAKGVRDRFGVTPDAEVGPDVDLSAEHIELADGIRLTDEVVVELVREVRSKAGGRPSLTGAGKRSPQVAFRVPETVRAQAAERAAAEGVTVSELARRALDEYLAHT